MKKITLIILLLSVFSICNAQRKDTIIVPQKPLNLVGIKTKEDFNQQPFKLWFNKNYANYTLDKNTQKKLKKYLKKVEIKAFMGTWCGDSRRETPKLFKLLDLVNYNQKKLTLITVDRSKKTPDNLQEGYDIVRVPTFIFYKKGKEIGRFVEYPRETLEKDILSIISGKPYKHSYDND